MWFADRVGIWRLHIIVKAGSSADTISHAANARPNYVNCHCNSSPFFRGGPHMGGVRYRLEAMNGSANELGMPATTKPSTGGMLLTFDSAFSIST